MWAYVVNGFVGPNGVDCPAGSVVELEPGVFGVYERRKLVREPTADELAVAMGKPAGGSGSAPAKSVKGGGKAKGGDAGGVAADLLAADAGKGEPAPVDQGEGAPPPADAGGGDAAPGGGDAGGGDAGGGE